ncbi:AAA family ATPase [Paenibacillus sp. MY03]|jgi:primosomal protein DnaI|uniref:ATPase AAA n=1 Tax=Paenibacillus agaridevorans TaxID=171404 RepID=A0A2R5EJ55_9BACL|nr:MULTISPECIES: primosomal protein DnaI [Paenibacillus]OUS68454.1 AAA family ATPase [Paenibacillus sp. MY03]GBG06567.1 ATPase AAA [Paenibacillus agaridevorans]
MESLGELLKSWPAGQSLTEQAERKLAELMREPLIGKLLDKYPDLNEDVLRLNLNRVYQYVTEYRNCSNCPGLDQCPNDYEGHYTLLSSETVNGLTQLYDRKVSCKKYLARQTEDAIRSRIRSFYVDDSALRRGYSSDEILTTDLERAKAVGQVLRYIDRTKDSGLQEEGLYLAGRFGTGKTFLMCYLLQELAKAGYSGVIVYMPDFVEDLKALMHEPGKLKETVEMMKETDLLIFDDIGAENLNPWVRDHVLGAILNYRMERKPTFYTSNYDLDALERHFSFTSKDGDELHKGQRLMDRVRPYVEVVMVTGENKRGRK